jgi:hypothetical protein
MRCSGQRLYRRTYGVRLDIVVTTGWAGTPGPVYGSPGRGLAGGIVASLVIGEPGPYRAIRVSRLG